MLQGHITREHMEYQEKGEYSFTGISDGKVLFVGGVSNYWKGRAEVWAILADHSGPKMLAITRAAKLLLSYCPIRRLELSVDCSFEPGHRWAEMLGFKMEAERMQKYLLDGKDATLYARVN